jgi:regulator of protease activity HflC (stomatin/prohibitin superfamily)
MIREETIRGSSGLLHLCVWPVVLLGATAWLVLAANADAITGWGVAAYVVAVLISALALAGLFTVHPNEPKVVQLFGAYRGSVHVPGLRWANPFYTKKKISVRTRNFETGKLKVNDSTGNPIEIGAVVVWKVVDTAEAMFNVDDFKDFVHVQSEAALRNLATGYPYDAHQADEKSLVGNTAEISDQLCEGVQERLEKAGVEVIETRISHLAYSPEIAAAMLQRQQASAVVAARSKIVEGAVGMVEHALELLSAGNVIHLDEERKAQMVSNLLVVLCSDHDAQPVVNTGTIYQ